MSCYGTCTTSLIELTVSHVVSMDDFGSPPNPLHSRIEVFFRLYRWEFQLSLRRPHRKFYFSREHGNIPRMFQWDACFDTLESKRYSGDFTPRMQYDEYYGQKPR